MKSTLTLLFTLSLFYAHAINYYVASNGLDTNNGTLSLPFLSIQHGSNQLNPGDTLFVREGTYFEKIYLNTSGTIGSPITITNYQNEEAIIDGTGITGNDILTISNKSYVTIKGLVFQNNYISGAKGIYILNEGTGILISNCTLRNIGWTTDPDADPTSISPTGQAYAILINGRTSIGINEVEVSDCHIYDIISGNSESLTLAGNVSDFQILRDTIHDTKNIGIVAAGHYSWAVDSGVAPELNQARNGHIIDCIAYNNRRFNNVDAPAGIYVDGGKNILVSRNTVYSNGVGLSVGCENAGFAADSIYVVNNIIYNNDNQGIYFGSNAATLTNSILKNNTIVENGSIGNFYSEVSLQNSTDCEIVQNILIPRSGSHYAVSIFGYTVSNLIVDNNLAFRYDGNLVNIYVEGTPSQFTPTNSMSTNPMFVDSLISNPDFRLRISSPAVDQGLLSYHFIDSLDQLKNHRLLNGKLDHGAIETIAANCPDILTLDNSYLHQGTFTANQEIILNSLSESTGQMEFFVPKITLANEFTLTHKLLVDEIGCQ